MHIKTLALLSLLGGQAALAAEWMPYSPIAIGSGENPDRRVADSLNTLISPIRVDQAGYLPGETEKKVYYVGDATEFEVVLASDSSVVGKGTWTSTGTTTESSLNIVAVKNSFSTDNADYTFQGKGPAGTLLKGLLPSGLPEDTPLRLRVGADYSADFIVSQKIYTYASQAMLRFFGLQQSKHAKDGAGSVVNASGSAVSGMSSREGALAGGWYDCGDYLKESQTQAYAASVLALLAATHSEKDQDLYDKTVSLTSQTDGIPDVLAEAKHGADFALAAYDFADGVIDNMPLSIGDFGSDHSFWGLPAVQEIITASGRGGPLDRDIRLGELGSNISAAFAANLAIVSKLYAPYDATYAEKCLKVAKEMYDFAKSLAQGKSTYGDGKAFVYNTKAAGWSTPAYNGNNEFYDEMALASVALLYATRESSYLDDAVKSKTLGVARPAQQFGTGAGIFDGGWFVTENKGFLKNVKNTSWANSYAYALYGLYKLIVETPEKAALYGIDEAYRLSLLEDIGYSMIYNLGSVSNGSGKASVALPNKGSLAWKSNVVTYDPIWFSMNTDQTWIYNRYQAGNIAEVLMYAEVAKNLESLSPALGDVSDWKAKEMRQLGLDQLHYMMGLNPWDMSFVYGIGDKNDMHPHHRQANPEGVNSVSHPAYPYTVPTGALYGGAAPGSTNKIEPASSSWADYYYSETCLDAGATLFAGVQMVADTAKLSAPKPEPEAALAPLANSSLNLQVGRQGNSIQVEARLSKAQEVRLQVLDLQGSVLMDQSLQGLAGANSWNLKLEGLRGLGLLRLRSGNEEKAVLLPRL